MVPPLCQSHTSNEDDPPRMRTPALIFALNILTIPMISFLCTMATSRKTYPVVKQLLRISPKCVTRWSQKEECGGIPVWEGLTYVSGR